MCGISCIYSKNKIDESFSKVIERMNSLQKHRGPDDEGIYANDTCMLGHRRLSIIDLSKNGHQPFLSRDGRYQLIFNGEIYNYIELREELKTAGWEFKTQTDTEVLLNSYIEYGKDCLDKFNGMFAFIIYDKEENKIFAARDRVGIKPLYYTQVGDKIYFASEIKALLSIEGINKQVEEKAIFDYLVFNRTDVFDETFFKGIKRFPKGHYCICDTNGMNFLKWWDPESFYTNETDKDINSISDDIEDILNSSLMLRMRSDVTVGSCLSGGLDSSILLGILMQNNMANEDYATFTAEFPGTNVDESKYVGALSTRYSFRNHRTFPISEKIYSILDEVISFHDEPILNPSYYIQYEVMRLAREKGVTVLIDGQGGDENFAGYHYFHGFYLYGLLKRKKYAQALTHLLGMILRMQKLASYQTLAFLLMNDKNRKRLLAHTVPFLDKAFFDNNISDSKIYKEFFNINDLNSSLVKHFQYKLEHLLRTEDRSSMAFSIEARVPYLDHRLIERLLKVAEELKVNYGATKQLEKIALGKYSVESILKRKDKLGFDTPIKVWMNEPKWHKLANESFEFLKRDMKNIFNAKAKLPSNSEIRWKLIQLAIWGKRFLN